MERRRILSIADVNGSAAARLVAGQTCGSWLSGEVVAVRTESWWPAAMITLADASGYCLLRVAKGKLSAVDARVDEGTLIEARVVPQAKSKERRWSWEVKWLDVVEGVGPLAFERARSIQQLQDAGVLLRPDGQRWKYDHDLAGVDVGRLRRVIALSPSSGADSWSDVEANLPKDVKIDRRRVTRRGMSMGQGCREELQRIHAGEADLVVMVRGGGDPEDFVEFDDYDLAGAITSCPVPVVTALGHASQVTLADRVAAKTFATPTAGMEAIKGEARRQFSQARAQSGRQRADRCRAEKNSLREQGEVLRSELDSARSASAAVAARAQRVERTAARLEDWVDVHLLELAQSRLRARSGAAAAALALAAPMVGAASWAGLELGPEFAILIAGLLSILAVLVRRLVRWPARPFTQNSKLPTMTRAEWRRRMFNASGPREIRRLVASSPVGDSSRCASR